jgi:hypothetical protein
MCFCVTTTSVVVLFRCFRLDRFTGRSQVIQHTSFYFLVGVNSAVAECRRIHFVCARRARVGVGVGVGWWVAVIPVVREAGCRD